MLKELIPDYNPGSKLLKAAVATESTLPTTSIQVLTGQPESILSANLAALAADELTRCGRNVEQERIIPQPYKMAVTMNEWKPSL